MTGALTGPQNCRGSACGGAGFRSRRNLDDRLRVARGRQVRLPSFQSGRACVWQPMEPAPDSDKPGEQAKPKLAT